MTGYTGRVPDTGPRPDRWRLQAACREVDPEIFFTDIELKAAKRVCGRCPVTDQCRSWILGVEAGWGFATRHGIYAGLTPRQRVRLDKDVPLPEDRPKPKGDSAARPPGNARRGRAPTNPPGGNPLSPCGTEGAYRRHQRYGEPIDAECLAAHDGDVRPLQEAS